MKKFLGKIILFLILLSFIDVLFGMICSYLTNHPKGGTTYHYYYLCKKSTEDVILMGSSRMCRHYNPEIIEDILKMSVYNAGIKGNGIILNYGMLCEILNRYKPKLIIYDIFSFDMYDDERFSEDNVRYLDNLKDYYNNPDIKSIFLNVNPSDRLKMFSMMYRYNSKFPRILCDFLYKRGIFKKGYNPYHGVMNYQILDDGRNNQQKIDKLKLYYFEKFIRKANENHIPLIVSASPRFGTSVDEHYNDPIKALCKEYNIPFLNYYANIEFSSHPEFFHDSNHLNETGADKFTEMITPRIKEIYDKYTYY